jgi:hypothetical protein
VTDLEMTQLCAEAMGNTISTDRISRAVAGPLGVWTNEHGHYDPLHSDAQCFALVKQFKLCITFIVPARPGQQWMASFCNDELRTAYGGSDDLNRAIVECVAKMSEP